MVKSKIFMAVLMFMPIMANASILYRVEQTSTPVPDAPNGYDAHAFSREHTFYIGGAYDFSMWASGTGDNNFHVGGKNTSSFDVSVGMRIQDIFRLEANYSHTSAKWTKFSLTGETFMLNAIFDARIDNIYRIFRTQLIVPYVGVGAGASWDKADDVEIGHKISPVAAALAGIGFELGEYFTVDLGYRYLYMFDPDFDLISDFAPIAHQFRAGVRVNF